jgi:hypothetical protein
MTTISKQIQPDNSYLVRQELRYYDDATNCYELWTEQDATVTFAEDTDGNTPIATLDSLVMSEAENHPGIYFLVVHAPLLQPALTPYVGQTIYQIVMAGAFNDLRVVTPLVVTEPRYAQ